MKKLIITLFTIFTTNTFATQNNDRLLIITDCGDKINIYSNQTVKEVNICDSNYHVVYNAGVENDKENKREFVIIKITPGNDAEKIKATYKLFFDSTDVIAYYESGGNFFHLW